MQGVYIKQFVDEELGNASYLIASEATGLAAVIDPWRDVDAYLQTADGLGLKLDLVLDTHLHADFISGGLELRHKLAWINLGASSDAHMAHAHRPLVHGDRLSLGDVSLQVLATPGHSLEHVSYVLSTDRPGNSPCVFSGGALIVGGVGRSDLQGPHLAPALASAQHSTLQERFLTMADDVVVYPTHGAGSLCTTGSSDERVTTIGRERRNNRFAPLLETDDFVREALLDLPPFPPYYGLMPDLNRRGAPLLKTLPDVEEWSDEDLAQWANRGGVVIDVRVQTAFSAGHLPGSLGIPLETPLIAWIGWVAPFGSPLALIADDTSQRATALTQLRRIGYDDVRGALQAGLAGWTGSGRAVSRWPVYSTHDLAERLDAHDAPLLIDVRTDKEWGDGHLPGALHVDATAIARGVDRVPRTDRQIVAYCALGNRSTVALSLLERRGHRQLALYPEGVDGWRKAGLAVSGDPT